MQNRIIGIVIGVTVALFALWMIVQNRMPKHEFDQAACHGPRLGSPAAREEALTAGYNINPRFDCIDKAAYNAGAAREVKYAVERKQEAAAKEARTAEEQTEEAQGLAFARSKFQTKVSVSNTDTPPLPLPTPPANLFVRVDYKSGQRTLPAFITPDKKDKQKRPAIIWLTGGDSNSLSDFWTPGSEFDDQSAYAFREAGIVMMFPVLRGGNGDTKGKEYFYGEVDDVIAAADFLATQPHVDPAQIYLGGHSTGGTLALLTATVTSKFARVFAFGPVTKANDYSRSLVPVNFGDLEPQELRLRSPIHWLKGIAKPTYIIEGMDGSGNIKELEQLCKQNANPQLTCVPVPEHDHYTVLPKMTRIIAARLAVAATGFEFALKPDEFKKAKGEK